MGEDIEKSRRPKVNVSNGTEAVKNRFRNQVRSNLAAEEKVENLVLCLDVSGSMDIPFIESDKSSPSRIRVLRQAAESLVLGSDRHGCGLGVVTYSDKAVVVSEVTRDYATLISKIREMKAGSITELGEGLSAAASCLGYSPIVGRKRIILLCDGQESARLKRAFDVLNEEILPKNIRVDCIAIGDRVDVRMLQFISSQTNGIFLQPKTPEEVERDFLRLESRARMLLTKGDAEG